MKKITNLKNHDRDLPGNPGVFIPARGVVYASDEACESCSIFLHRLERSGFVTIEDVAADEVPEGHEEPKLVEVTHKGGGRWVVTVGGVAVHDGYLKKAEAQAMAEEYQ